jgi:hypothetical protein
MKNLIYRGGARKGLVNVTWPLVTLKISKTQLELKAFMIGELCLSRKDIVSITIYSGFFSKGLQISYQRDGIREKIIFWTWQNPRKVMRELENFWDEKPEAEEVAKIRKKNFFFMKNRFKTIDIILLCLIFGSID